MLLGLLAETRTTMRNNIAEAPSSQQPVRKTCVRLEGAPNTTRSTREAVGMGNPAGEWDAPMCAEWWPRQANHICSLLSSFEVGA